MGISHKSLRLEFGVHSYSAEDPPLETTVSPHLSCCESYLAYFTFICMLKYGADKEKTIPHFLADFPLEHLVICFKNKFS